MCSKPLKPLTVPTGQRTSRGYGFRHLRRARDGPEEKDEKSMSDYVLDLEGRMSSAEQPIVRHVDRTLDLNHYRIVDEVWHFSSVDWGSNCKVSIVGLDAPALWLNEFTKIYV